MVKFVCGDVNNLNVCVLLFLGWIEILLGMLMNENFVYVLVNVFSGFVFNSFSILIGIFVLNLR